MPGTETTAPAHDGVRDGIDPPTVAARFSLADLRAALWAYRALSQARPQLAAGRIAGVMLPESPEVPADARRGVEALLRRRRHTSLEAAVLRQRWLAAHGISRKIVIGVGSGGDEPVTQAWIDGEDAVAGCSELTRV